MRNEPDNGSSIASKEAIARLISCNRPDIVQRGGGFRVQAAYNGVQGHVYLANIHTLLLHESKPKEPARSQILCAKYPLAGADSMVAFLTLQSLLVPVSTFLRLTEVAVRKVPYILAFRDACIGLIVRTVARGSVLASRIFLWFVNTNIPPARADLIRWTVEVFRLTRYTIRSFGVNEPIVLTTRKQRQHWRLNQPFATRFCTESPNAIYTMIHPHSPGARQSGLPFAPKVRGELVFTSNSKTIV